MTAYSRIYLRLISDNLQKQLGLPRADAESLRELCNSDEPQPLVLENGRGTVWLDPYYAAFRMKNGKLIYVYISKKHILEEVDAYRAAAKMRRDKSIRLPAEIRAQFSRALRAMRLSNTDVWVETADFSALV